MRKIVTEKFMRKNLNTNERKMEGKTMMKTMRKILFVTLLFAVVIALFGKFDMTISRAGNVKADMIRNFKEIPMTTKTVKRGKNYYVNVFWRKHRIATYRFRVKPIVKFIHTDELTYEKLTTRKGKVLYIEWSVGKQINKKGDGKLFVKDPRYNYISYKRCGFKKGDIIRTFCVYSPYTFWVDDIVERYDEKLR